MTELTVRAKVAIFHWEHCRTCQQLGGLHCETYQNLSRRAWGKENHFKAGPEKREET